MSTVITSLINQLSPILVAAIVGVLVILIRKAGDELKIFIPYAQQLLENKLGIDKTKQLESEAMKVWGMVDENFRITQFVGDTIKAKQDMFKELLLKKIPGLTDDEITTIRQEIAGVINKGKESMASTINTVSITQDELSTLKTKAVLYDQMQNIISTSTNNINTQPVDTTTSNQQ